MQKVFDLLVKIENKKTEVNCVYQILGKYGDKLPKDIQEELYVKATNLQKEVENLRKKVSNLYFV